MKLTANTINTSNNIAAGRIFLDNTAVVQSITLGSVSITPSEIDVGNVSITPSSVSVPTLVIGGTQFTGGGIIQGGIINYTEFTANGTWTNPLIKIPQINSVSQGLQYSYYTGTGTSNPTDEAGFSLLFTAPANGSGIHSGTINWGSSGTGAGGAVGTKPAYLPTDQFAWKVEGYLLAPETGTYSFGVDSDDGSDVYVDGFNVASWYGGHGLSGTWSGNTGGAGQISNTIYLVANTYYSFRARMQEGTGSDGLQVGWKKPSDASIGLIPANAFFYGTVSNTVNTLTGYEQALIMAWGGGGGGSANASWGGGGGGGACFVGFAPLNAFANTCAVTVGLGGAGTLSGTAASGGTTSFVINSSATVYAYGGSGTTILTNMGAGGGVLGAASGSTGGAPLGGTIGNPAGSSTFGGGGGGNATASYVGGSSIFGGAGAYNATSIYGGGVSGGNTVFGGAGGVYATTPAQAPGGGGTYFLNDTVSSTGARGEVRVWVFGPGGTTAGAPTYALTANTTSLVENSSVLFTVSTTNVSNGTNFYYTLNNSSVATSADFTTAVNGSVIINGGTASFVLTAVDDSDAVNENFQMDIRTGSTTGPIVASNNSVSIVPLPAVSVINRSTVSINTTNQTTYTFSNMAIGTASATRRVIAVLTADDGSTGGRTLSSATIGGITANIDAQVTHTSGGSGVVAIVSATVPTGTTATVVANYSGGLARATCWVVAVDNLQSVSPYDTLTDTNSLLTGTIDWLKDGFVVAGATMNSDAATFTWSGITERYETDYGTATAGGGDLLTTTTATNQTITATDVGGTPTRFAMAAVSYR